MKWRARQKKKKVGPFFRDFVGREGTLACLLH